MNDIPRLDPWQFRLAAGPGRAIAGLGLQVGDGLPMIELTDCDGTYAGVLLGHPIDLEKRLCLTSVWAASVKCVDAGEFASSVLRALGGRFVLIVDLPNARRLYPDAAAQIPCVFDDETGRAGSTAHALFSDEEYDERFDQGLYDAFGIDQKGWFPCGLTAHRGLSRVLPSHVLDLETWTVSRGWGLSLKSMSTEAAIDALVETVESQMAAFRSAGRCVAQALTAGRETRMLLAMSHEHSDTLEFVTIAGSGQYSVDGIVAKQIAKRFGLKHRSLSQVLANAKERDRYLRRGGHCVADANSWYFPSVAPLADGHVFVGGAGGEVGRGFYWKPGDTENMPIDAKLLAHRFGMPADDRLIARLNDWLNGLEGLSAFEILDLAYLEQRVGPWGSAQFCSDPTLLRFAPLLTRKGIEAMMALPPDWKRSEGMSREVVAATWPELAEVPYNSAGRLRDTLAKIQRVLRNPGLIVKAISKRL